MFRDCGVIVWSLKCPSAAVDLAACEFYHECTAYWITGLEIGTPRVVHRVMVESLLRIVFRARELDVSEECARHLHQLRMRAHMSLSEVDPVESAELMIFAFTQVHIVCVSIEGLSAMPFDSCIPFTDEEGNMLEY